MNDALSPDPVTAGIKAAYDAIDYDCTPHPQTHPDRLRVVARMFGVDAPALSSARVLEVGCGDGSNLIPIADAFPQATFVGCDLAPRAIDAGNALIGAAGLGNVRLLNQDLRELPASLGDFDYVIAHGFYSWVPPQVRDALMELIATRMTANGVAFISYNTYPGNRVCQIASDAMNWHSRNNPSAQDKLRASREMLKMMATPGTAQWPPDNSLRVEFADRAARADSMLYHDDLAHPNDSFYFHEFMAHAGRYGLDYIGDSDVRLMSGGGLDPEVRRFVQRASRLEREQYLDFMRLRRFRQSLLTKAKSSSNFDLVPAQVHGMRITAATTLMQSMGEAVQRGQPRDSVLKGGSPPVNAMLIWLADLFPRTVSASDIGKWRSMHAPEDRRSLEEVLTEAYIGGVVDFYLQPAAQATHVSERPRASRIARLQARSRVRVVNLRHDSVNLTDEFARKLLPLLDGTRDHATLLAALGTGFDRGSAGLEGMLRFFARISLLLA